MSTTDQVSNQIDVRSPSVIGLVGNDVGRSDSRQWTIKGVANETVEVSRDAAKRSGMKLNAWISRALEQAASGADQRPSCDSTAATPIAGDETIQRIQEELVRLRAQNEDMRDTVSTMSNILLKLWAEKI